MALVVVTAALALPATVQAGGWATVELGSSPEGVQAGQTWTAEIEILQHGVTPLDGVRPRVLIEGPQGEARTFGATPTGEPGVYRARVIFPRGGIWDYAVDDGFTQTHTFAPVTIDGAPAPAAATASAGGGVGWVAAVGVLAGVGLLAALVLAARRVRSARSPWGAR